MTLEKSQLGVSLQSFRNLTWFLVSYGLLILWLANPVGIGFLDSSGPTLPISFLTLSLMLFFFMLGFLTNSKVLRSGSTLVHELGHAFAIGLVKGQVHSIQARIDNSGQTQWAAQPNRFKETLVSISGPLANSVVFAVLLEVLSTGINLSMLPVFALLLLVIALTSIRSLWGWISIIFLIVIILLLDLISTGNAVTTLLPLSAASSGQLPVLSVLSLISLNAGVGLRYSTRSRKLIGKSSDEAKIASSLGIPKSLASNLVSLIYVLIFTLQVFSTFEQLLIG